MGANRHTHMNLLLTHLAFPMITLKASSVKRADNSSEEQVPCLNLPVLLAAVLMSPDLGEDKNKP
jgi:hypothetical protein